MNGNPAKLATGKEWNPVKLATGKEWSPVKLVTGDDGIIDKWKTIVASHWQWKGTLSVEPLMAMNGTLCGQQLMMDGEAV